MNQRHNTSEQPKTLWGYFLKALREANSWRPASFYLLFAIPVVMILAAPVFYVRDDPKRFALHLALLFVFFFVIVLLALADCIEIGRWHRAERRKAFRKTLGEEFARKLGERATGDREK